LIIRKTINPNHAKLYISNYKVSKLVETNFLSQAAAILRKQDYQRKMSLMWKYLIMVLKMQEKYFDALWETAVLINEKEDFKKN